MNQPEEHWKRLASAARRSAGEEAPDHAPAPGREEIARRLGALRGTLREMFVALLWRHWAVAAVALAIIAYIVVYLILNGGSGGSSGRPEIPLPFPP